MAGGVRGRFASTISKIKEIRGEEAEEKVAKALEELKKKGIIRDFGQPPKFGIEDLKGIDFIIFWRSNQKIYLQVKGYYDGKEQEKYSRKGIYVVVALPEENVEIMKKKILDIIKKE